MDGKDVIITNEHLDGKQDAFDQKFYINERLALAMGWLKKNEKRDYELGDNLLILNLKDPIPDPTWPRRWRIWQVLESDTKWVDFELHVQLALHQFEWCLSKVDRTSFVCIERVLQCRTKQLRRKPSHKFDARNRVWRGRQSLLLLRTAT